MTLEPSRQQEIGASMSSAEDSLVRTSATLAAVTDSMENGAGYGESTQGCFAFLDHQSLSWKTHQLCLFEECQSSYETWPESGSMRNGACYPHAPWVPHMCDDDCSLWPTPTASMGRKGFGLPLHGRTFRYKQATVRRVKELVGSHGWKIHPHFIETVMGFPTDASAITH